MDGDRETDETRSWNWSIENHSSSPMIRIRYASNLYSPISLTIACTHLLSSYLSAVLSASCVRSFLDRTLNCATLVDDKSSCFVSGCDSQGFRGVA